MIAVRTFGWLIASSAGVALAGCVTTQSSLTNSAERLERSDCTLQDEARSDESSSYYRDAQAFAEEARGFRRTIDDRRADNDDRQDAFRELTSRYQALRDESEHDAEHDFNAVTQAYLDVEREMNEHQTRRDRYARDDD